MSAKTLGQLIAVRRKERGITQTQLADKLGINQSRISQYENGEKVPHQYMEHLAQILDIRPEDFVAHIAELFTATEAAILRDPFLSRKEQDALLSAYGHLTGRTSFERASSYRSLGEHWEESRTKKETE
ncbi:helix-turn-helix domain-containing protein [Planotetraspora sp. GP83]|uniref:helix-turn-helix domain-containing protein n=1 Tax=Planotetraspora sp. GP83 TaxID=3156264 RepID=UPI0035173CFA